MTVIVAASLPAAVAAKTATSAVPIVFVSGADPVKFRLIASMNKPGGNATRSVSVFRRIGRKTA